jgi:hypothetical protein
METPAQVHGFPFIGNLHGPCGVFELEIRVDRTLMVSQKYLLDRPSPPSKPRQFFMQRVLPELVDLSASLEAGLERVAVSTRRHPSLGLGLALSAGAVLSLLTRRRLEC